MDNRDECALLTRRLLIALLLIAAAFRSGSGLHAYTVDRQMDYSQFNRQCNGKSIKYLTDHAWKAVMRERYDSAAAYYSVAASRYSASLSDSDIYRWTIATVKMQSSTGYATCSLPLSPISERYISTTTTFPKHALIC